MHLSPPSSAASPPGQGFIILTPGRSKSQYHSSEKSKFQNAVQDGDRDALHSFLPQVLQSGSPKTDHELLGLQGTTASSSSFLCLHPPAKRAEEQLFLSAGRGKRQNNPAEAHLPPHLIFLDKRGFF